MGEKKLDSKLRSHVLSLLVLRDVPAVCARRVQAPQSYTEDRL